jgi:PTH2 family peptidyl-tRNA hydrolase
MGKGKLAVQVAHASVSALEQARRSQPDWVKTWFLGNQRKICVKANTESDLIDLKLRIEKQGLPHALIEDAGLTQLEPGTVTCLGIGPLPAEIVDRFTGELKLL